MNNQNYTVVHSIDPWLLARLSTDLMMEGIKDDRKWNEYFLEPSEEELKRGKDLFSRIKYMAYIGDPEGFCLFEEVYIIVSTDFTLTTRNYNKVLKTIIERHGGGR